MTLVSYQGVSFVILSPLWLLVLPPFFLQDVRGTSMIEAASTPATSLEVNLFIEKITPFLYFPIKVWQCENCL